MKAFSRLLFPVWMAVAAAAGGCAHRPAPAKTASAAVPVLPPSRFVLPQQTPTPPAADDALLRKMAWVVMNTDDAPERRQWRDALVTALADRFAALPESREEERRQMFVWALALHAPVEVRAGVLSAALEPMARWIWSHFERAGNEGIVLAALGVLRDLHPDDGEIRAAFDELHQWIRESRAAFSDPLERARSLSRALGGAMLLYPHRELRDDFVAALAERQKTVVSMLGSLENRAVAAWAAQLRGLAQLGGVGPELTAAFLLSGGEAELLGEALRSGIPRNGLEDDVADFGSRFAEGTATAEDYFTAARYAGAASDTAGMYACAKAYRLEPEPVYALCAARFMHEMDLSVSAVEVADRVLVDIGDETAAAFAASLYRETVSELLEDPASADTLRWVVEAAARFVDHVAAEHAEAGDMGRIAGAVAELIANAAYSSGWSDDAVRWFSSARTLLDDTPLATLRLAQIHMYRGACDKAVPLLERLIAGPHAGDMPPVYWEARAWELRGDCHRDEGDEAAAQQAYQRAYALWKETDFPEEFASEHLLYFGRVAFKLHKESEATALWEQAVQRDPASPGPMAGILSFLVGEGRADLAATFYEIAFNQEYDEPEWKIYFSLWVDLGMSVCCDGTSALASGFLRSFEGTTWQADLARFASGRLDAAALQQRARAPGHEVEARFYVALDAWRRGQRDEALGLLHQVLDSSFYGYYEFQIARALLRALPGSVQ